MKSNDVAETMGKEDKYFAKNNRGSPFSRGRVAFVVREQHTVDIYSLYNSA